MLVATDIAARGIDINQLPCVINFDLPYVAKDYVHRIGRTGRAGKKGHAISLFSDDEVKQLNAIERLINRKFHVTLSQALCQAGNVQNKCGAAQKITHPLRAKKAIKKRVNINLTTMNMAILSQCQIHLTRKSQINENVAKCELAVCV